MPDVAAILSRVRAQGADIVLADGRMTLAGGAKLSIEARAYITEHRAAIAAYLQEQLDDAIDERAAIIEFEAGAPREWAEQFARILYMRRPAGVSDLDWTWFVSKCGRIIDDAMNTLGLKLGNHFIRRGFARLDKFNRYEWVPK